MVKFTGFGKTMSSFAVGLQSFPSVAWVPFAILLIGLNDIGILFVVIMSSVFSVMISAYSGIRNITPIYLKAARSMVVCLARFDWGGNTNGCCSRDRTHTVSG